MPDITEIVDGAGFGQVQWLATILGGGVYLADGAEVIIVGAVTGQLAGAWGLSHFERGVIVSVVFVGTFFANIVAGSLSDILGRRYMLLVSYIGVFVSSALSLLSFNAWSLAFFRFFVGVFFGSGGPAWNALGAEVSPATSRLWVAGVGQCMFALGEAYSAILLWISGSNYEGINWRLLILLGCIPCLILGIAAFFLLDESPRFSLKKGRIAEAQSAVDRLYRLNGKGVAPKVESTQETIPLTSLSLSVPQMFKESLIILLPIFGQKFLFTTLTLCACTFTLNFNYYGGLYAFPQVFARASFGLPAGPALLISSLLEIPGFVFGVWLGERLDRKSTMLAYVGLSAVSAFCMLYTPTLDLGVFGLKFFGSVGWLIFYLYTAEVFPTEIRTSASGFCMAAGRLGGIISPIVFETASGGQNTFFTAISILLLVNFILVIFLPFETKNAALDSENLDSRNLPGLFGKVRELISFR